MRRGAVVETEAGRHIASLHDAETRPHVFERQADVAQRIVDCVNALEGARRPAQAVDDARNALALAYDWLLELQGAVGQDALRDALQRTGRTSLGLMAIREALAAIGQTQEERLARQLMGGQA